MKKIFLALSCIAAMASSAQLKMPAPSPTQTIKQDFGLSSIELTYSRPGMKGRKIFGDLVPYGEMWRTGANAATRIKFGEDVTIGGQAVKAGEYALYTIPNQNEWEIILNKGVTNGGLNGYKKEEDVTRFKVKPTSLPAPVETFTMEIGEIKPSSSELQLKWENTAVKVPITTDVDTKVMGQINDIMNKDNRPYFQSAMYYMESGKDMKQALAWFDKAIEQNPKGFWIYHQKANALVKMGKKDEAKIVAQKSMDIAREEKNDDYVRLNEKLLATLK
jgi:tetratricopeptide (TPR) repeat protein